MINKLNTRHKRAHHRKGNLLKRPRIFQYAITILYVLYNVMWLQHNKHGGGNNNNDMKREGERRGDCAL